MHQCRCQNKVAVHALVALDRRLRRLERPAHLAALAVEGVLVVVAVLVLT